MAELRPSGLGDPSRTPCMDVLADTAPPTGPCEPRRVGDTGRTLGDRETGNEEVDKDMASLWEVDGWLWWRDVPVTRTCWPLSMSCSVDVTCRLWATAALMAPVNSMLSSEGRVLRASICDTRCFSRKSASPNPPVTLLGVLDAEATCTATISLTGWCLEGVV